MTIKKMSGKTTTIAASLATMIVAVGMMLFGGCGGDGNPANGGIVDGGTLTDSRDGQDYRTVMIGGKRWMAENLNYVADSSWCYDDTASYCGEYGRLYAWDAAVEACPAGWRLPDTADWNGLARAAGGRRMEAIYDDYGEVFYYWDLPVPSLKSKTGWHDGWNGTDRFGFSALPGGVRDAGGFYAEDALYVHVGMYGLWWSATEDDIDVAHYRYMYYESSDVGEDHVDKSAGLSVRCIKS